MRDHPVLSAGRVAVITGAAGGIGLGAALRFAKMGMKVCLADLPSEALEQAAQHGYRVSQGLSIRVIQAGELWLDGTGAIGPDPVKGL